MTQLSKRVGALEARAPAAAITCHRIIQRSDQSYDEALDESGRDRIAVGDKIIVRRIVTLAREGKLA